MRPSPILLAALAATLTFAANAAFAAAAPAQEPRAPAPSRSPESPVSQAPAGAKPQDRGKPKPILASNWSEARSRALFDACDANGDGRLDLFETADAFDLLEGVTDLDGYRRLDRDRDGFVAHAEFDRHFRAVVRRGDALRLRPSKPVAPAKPRTAPGSPLGELLRLADTDGSDDLDSAEIDALVAKLRLPPEWPALLKGLDADRSGSVDEAELQPLVERLLPAGGPTGPAPARAPELPEAWRHVDANGDRKITEKELQDALTKVDPKLASWAKPLVAGTDKDGDGVLGAAELPPQPPTATELQAWLRGQ